jgi:hypothetical protein
MSKTKEQATAELCDMVPALRKSIKEAKRIGHPQIGVMAVTGPDGSGHVLARIDGEGFFEALAVLLGVEAFDVDERREAENIAYLRQFDATGPGH